MKLGGIECTIFTSSDPTYFSTKAVSEAEKRVPLASIHKAEELASEIEDDIASCYFEVPTTKDERTAPVYFCIFYRIGDLTYTHQIKCDIDGGRIPQIVTVHSGKTATDPLKTNTGILAGIALTTDWSKSRGLKFESTGNTTTEGGRPKSRLVLDEQETNGLGEIKISFFRAESNKKKNKSTGFHQDAPVSNPDPSKIPLSISHKTGLGPIIFGPPKKIAEVTNIDSVPYVTFVFKYRSKEFLPEDWLLTSIPTADELPTSPNLVEDTQKSPVTVKRSSTLALKAGKWARDLKDGVKDVHIPVHISGTTKRKDKLGKTAEEPTSKDAPETPPKEKVEGEAAVASGNADA